MRRQLPALALIAAINSASADSINPVVVWYELTPGQRQKLERTACLNPYRLPLHSGFADGDLPDDQTDFTAYALCETHRYVDNNPVAYEVDCDPAAGDWKCTAREIITATFPDRRIFIVADNASPEDAYAVVKHFVTAQAFEPGTYSNDIFGRIAGKHDECVVKGAGDNRFDVKCQVFSASVKRDPSSSAAKFVRM